jgi:hypothetical protein
MLISLRYAHKNVMQARLENTPNVGALMDIAWENELEQLDGAEPSSRKV